MRRFDFGCSTRRDSGRRRGLIWCRTSELDLLNSPLQLLQLLPLFNSPLQLLQLLPLFDCLLQLLTSCWRRCLWWRHPCPLRHRGRRLVKRGLDPARLPVHCALGELLRAFGDLSLESLALGTHSEQLTMIVGEDTALRVGHRLHGRWLDGGVCRGAIPRRPCGCRQVAC